MEDVKLDEKFRRKGIINFIYDYIEDDLSIILIPSTDQSEDAKAFWKNRLKNSAEYQTRAGKAFWKNRLSKK